jgi:hypothetical protein
MILGATDEGKATENAGKSQPNLASRANLDGAHDISCHGSARTLVCHLFSFTLCSMGLHQNDTLYEPCWLNFATGRHSDVVQVKVTWQGETRGHKWSLIGNLSYKHSEFVVGHWHLHHWAKNP